MKTYILFALLVLGICVSINGCKVGWLPFTNGKCYMFSRKDLTATWAEASSICEAFKGILAEPRNNASMEFLISHTHRVGDGNFWIGVSDIVEENVYVYSSTQEPVSVSHWGGHDPSGTAGENCVLLWQGFGGKWGDYYCDQKERFICEVDNELNPEVVG